MNQPKPLDRSRYERMRQAGFTDDEIRADGFEIPPKAPGSGARTATGILGKFAQGISMGTADEIGGAILSPFAEGKSISEKYRNARDIVRGVLNDAQEKAPIPSTLAEIGGAIAPAFVGAGTLIPRAAATGIRGAATRGAANVAEGAILGAAAGAGNAEGGAAERITGAARGARGGAMGSAVLGAAGPALQTAYRGTVGAITRRGVNRAANRVLADAIEQSGMSADAVRSAINDSELADKPLTLMEHLGVAGRKAARGARTMSAQARQTLDNTAEQRMPGAYQRVTDDIREGLNVSHQTPTQATAQSTAHRADIALDEFTPERMAAEVDTRTLQHAPIYADLFEQMQHARGQAPGGPLARLPELFDAETGQLVRQPTVRDIEDIRQAFDDVQRSGRYHTVNRITGRSEVRNVDGQMARSLEAARQHMLADPALEAAAPWYAPARRALEEQHQFEEAIPTGHAMPGRDPQDITDALEQMTVPSKRGARVGFAAAKAQEMMKAPPVSVADKAGGIGATRKQAIRDQVNAMVPNGLRSTQQGPRTRQQTRMESRLDAESRIAATERFLSGQSETADKAMEGTNVMMRALQAVRGSDPMQLASIWLNARMQGNTGRVAQEIARRMSTLSRAEQQAFLEEIAQTQAERAARRAVGGRTVTGRAGGAAGGLLP